MPRVKGLLYLSDGYGDFLEETPDYPVTRLLLEDCGGGPARCASWAPPGWARLSP